MSKKEKKQNEKNDNENEFHEFIEEMGRLSPEVMEVESPYLN